MLAIPPAESARSLCGPERWSESGQLKTMPNKEDKLGALWAKSGGKGDYFSGEIEIGGVKTKVVVFANGFKQGDKHPDWIIYKSQPKGERTVGADDAMPF
jgi:hypothetical protein